MIILYGRRNIRMIKNIFEVYENKISILRILILT